MSRDMRLYRTKFKSRARANFRPIKLTDRNVFTGTATSNRVSSLLMLRDNFFALNVTGLPRSTMVGARHLTIAD